MRELRSASRALVRGESPRQRSSGGRGAERGTAERALGGGARGPRVHRRGCLAEWSGRASRTWGKARRKFRKITRTRVVGVGTCIRSAALRGFRAHAGERPVVDMPGHPRGIREKKNCMAKKKKNFRGMPRPDDRAALGNVLAAILRVFSRRASCLFDRSSAPLFLFSLFFLSLFCYTSPGHKTRKVAQERMVGWGGGNLLGAPRPASAGGCPAGRRGRARSPPPGRDVDGAPGARLDAGPGKGALGRGA